MRWGMAGDDGEMLVVMEGTTQFGHKSTNARATEWFSHFHFVMQSLWLCRKDALDVPCRDALSLSLMLFIAGASIDRGLS